MSEHVMYRIALRAMLLHTFTCLGCNMESELALTISSILTMSLDMLKVTYRMTIPSELTLPVTFPIKNYLLDFE